MRTFVLIFVIFFGDTQTVNTVEFSSKERCTQAKQQVLEELKIHKNSPTITATCLERVKP